MVGDELFVPGGQGLMMGWFGGVFSSREGEGRACGEEEARGGFEE